MSTEHDKPQQNQETDSQQETPSQRKPRSPVERVLVWGGIALLAVLAGLQGWAQLHYSQTLSAWQEAIVKMENDPEAPAFTKQDAEKMIRGNPEQSAPQQEGIRQSVIYTWSGPIRDYSITLSYTNDENEEVLEFASAGAKEEEDADRMAGAPQDGAAEGVDEEQMDEEQIESTPELPPEGGNADSEPEASRPRPTRAPAPETETAEESSTEAGETADQPSEEQAESGPEPPALPEPNNSAGGDGESESSKTDDSE